MASKKGESVKTVKPKKTPFEIKSPKESASEGLNILVYGRPGVGKTVLAGTAEDDPRLCRVLVLDIEGGVLSISARGKNLDVTRIRSMEDFADVYEYLYEGDHPYQCVVIDSLTEVQKLAMTEIMLAVADARPDRDPDIASRQEWGKNIEQVRKLVRYFRDLPIHTVFTCLEQEIQDESTGDMFIRPSLPGKLAGEIGGFVDIVGRLSIRTRRDGEEDEEGTAQITGSSTHRVLQVQPTGKVDAKDRSDALDPEYVDPTLSMILEDALKA